MRQSPFDLFVQLLKHTFQTALTLYSTPEGSALPYLWFLLGNTLSVFVVGLFKETGKRINVKNWQNLFPVNRFSFVRMLNLKLEYTLHSL